MSESLNCNEVETLLFERRREELTELREAMVERHLKNCPACRETAAKMDDLFDVAADDDPTLWADIDADTLFESVEDAIADDASHVEEFDEAKRLDELFELAGEHAPVEAGDVDAEATFEGISQRVCDDEQSQSPPPSRGRILGIAIAAAACVAVAGWWILAADDELVSYEDTKAPSAQSAESNASGSIDDIGPSGIFPPLRAASTPLESLRLFADDGADYELLATDEEDTIELNDGMLLLELSPDARDAVSVRVHSHTVTVTGTVFSVETGDGVPRVAVYEGSVDVTDPDGERRRLTAGEYIDRGTTGTVGEAEYSQIEAHVDLAEHRRLLHEANRRTGDMAIFRVHAAVDAATADADAASTAFAPIKDGRHLDEEAPSVIDEEIADEGDGESESDALTAEEAAGEPSPPSPAKLHEEALTALHEDRPQEAADRLVEALALTEPSERARADILLELAGIELRQLDNPQMAAQYMEQFVDQWPDDPAADAIRNQLCELGIGEGDCR